MNDLCDVARPIRDAAIAEVTRLTGGADFDADARAANILGVHLSAVILAFAADRHKQTDGIIRDEGLHQVLPSGIAGMIANAAMAFRPVFNGQPVPPSAVAFSLLESICHQTMAQVATSECGAQDFVIPFRRTESGELEVTPFDFAELMKEKP